MKSIKLLVLTIAVLGMFFGAANAADCGGDIPCSCGDTLNESRTLNESDSLTGCSGDALEIDASGITLDCAGYTISGTGTEESSGIYADNVDSLIIQNCVITNFSTAVYFDTVANSMIIGGEIGINNQDYGVTAGGVYLTGAPNNTINGVYLHENKGGAVYIYSGSDWTTVENSNIDNNCGDSREIYVEDSNNVQIQNNNVTDGTGYGIEIVDSDAANIIGNNISNNFWAGIYIRGVPELRSDHLISGNDIIGNGVGGMAYGGIEIYGEDNVTITGNYISSNYCSGIYTEDSYDLVIADSVIEYNGAEFAGSGPYGCEGIEMYNSDANISNVNFSENYCGDDGDGNGLYVDNSSEVNLLNSNFIENLYDGIYTESQGIVNWILMNDVECTNNDIYIADGMIIPAGGNIIGDCQIQVGEYIFDENQTGIYI